MCLMSKAGSAHQHHLERCPDEQICAPSPAPLNRVPEKEVGRLRGAGGVDTYTYSHPETRVPGQTPVKQKPVDLDQEPTE